MVDIYKPDVVAGIIEVKLAEVRRILSETSRLHYELATGVPNAGLEEELMRLVAARTALATELGLVIVREIGQGRTVAISVSET